MSAVSPNLIVPLTVVVGTFFFSYGIGGACWRISPLTTLRLSPYPLFWGGLRLRDPLDKHLFFWHLSWERGELLMGGSRNLCAFLSFPFLRAAHQALLLSALLLLFCPPPSGFVVESLVITSFVLHKLRCKDDMCAVLLLLLLLLLLLFPLSLLFPPSAASIPYSFTRILYT